VKIPTVREAPEDFISRVAALLSQPDAHLYFDTNVLIWVTLLAPVAREQFLSLLDSMKAHAHVPTWAMNEFYRFHRDNYLQRQLNAAADALTKSIKEFSAYAKRYGAQSGLAEATFIDRVERMAQEAKELKRIAHGWKYEDPARETIEWMNRIACEDGIDFKLLGELKRVGVARYSHDVPPGYEDDHKRSREGRATNRFGDLLFWQEILAHSSKVGAKTVIVVTNDRKEDWYFDQGDPDVGNGLRQLGVSKWEPVPSPHPLLAYEMNDACHAELVLVDQLYFGAVAWQIDKKNMRQLVGAALAIPEANIVRAESAFAPPPIRPGGSLTPVRAFSLIRDAFAVSSASVDALVKAMDGEVAKVDALIATMDVPFIEAMTETDTVLLARHLGDLAIADHPMAVEAVKRLLDLLASVAADHAASIHLGLAVASYYDGAKPRPIPRGSWLDTLADYQGQPAMQQTVTKLHSRLVRDTSPALYFLNAQDLPCMVTLDVDTQRAQDPAELSGARVNDKAVLTNESVQGPALRDLVGEVVATTTQIIDAMCAYFGIPRTKAKFDDAVVRRLIPAELFLRLPDRLEMLLEKQDSITDLQFEIGDSGLDENELVDAIDIEPDDDHDEVPPAVLVAGGEGEGE